MTTGRRILRRLPLAVTYLVMVAGICVMMYPSVSNWVLEYKANKEISGYAELVAQMDKEDVEQELAKAREYNDSLSSTGSGAMDYQTVMASTSVMEFLEIPKIGVYLPIYHGTDDEVLERGVGHMEGTSMPVGGESTHAVLNAHTGLPSARLFTDLDQMEIGDVFYLHVMDEILAYEVDQIQVVLPEEVSGIRIEKGRDLVTLVTCTPYGINDHRLLVRGSRIPYETETTTVSAAAPADSTTADAVKRSVWFLYGTVAGGVILVIIFLYILFGPEKKKTKKEES